MKAVQVFAIRYEGGTVHVLATCQAVHDPDRQWHRYCLPVEGLLSGADLLFDRVKVVASNEQGDSGELEIDGGCQVRMIRDHLGVPVETIIDLDFGRDGNASRYLGTGWSKAETESTWTLDDDSWITFDAPNGSGPYRLRLGSRAHLRPGELTKQTMSIFLNEQLVASFMATDGSSDYEDFKVPVEVFSMAPRTSLRLHHPDAARPCDFSDSQDSRRLAFAVKRIWLVRISAT